MRERGKEDRKYNRSATHSPAAENLLKIESPLNIGIQEVSCGRVYILIKINGK